MRKGLNILKYFSNLEFKLIRENIMCRIDQIIRQKLGFCLFQIKINICS